MRIRPACYWRDEQARRLGLQSKRRSMLKPLPMRMDIARVFKMTDTLGASGRPVSVFAQHVWLTALYRSTSKTQMSRAVTGHLQENHQTGPQSCQTKRSARKISAREISINNVGENTTMR